MPKAMSARGRECEVANDGFVEFNFAESEFGGTTALEKTDWLKWVDCEGWQPREAAASSQRLGQNECDAIAPGFEHHGTAMRGEIHQTELRYHAHGSSHF